jgi:Tetratricopeptide repeat
VRHLHDAAGRYRCRSGHEHARVQRVRRLGPVPGDAVANRRALRIKEREFDPNHREVTDILNNLGNTRARLGQPAKARDLFERALQIFHAHFPSGHPSIGRAVRDLRSVAPDVIVLDDGRVVDPPGKDDQDGCPMTVRSDHGGRVPFPRQAP